MLIQKTDVSYLVLGDTTNKREIANKKQDKKNTLQYITFPPQLNCRKKKTEKLG